MTVKEAAAKLIIFATALYLGQQDTTAQSSRTNPPKFLGRTVTVVEPSFDDFFPKGPASICIEGPPQRQCYTAPKDYGRAPSVELVQVGKDMPALLFSAASGGVSGFGIHFALLRPGTEKTLEDLFMADVSVSNQSEYELWNDSAISTAPIFVTADYVLGPDEGHYGPHRYIVSSYVLKYEPLLDGFFYLEDRYMTAHKYDLDANQELHVLTSEKREMIGRLRRLAAETAR